MGQNRDNLAMLTFAQTAEAVGATRSRLKKAAILAAYFGSLDDADLSRAALYLSGRAFPLWDERVLSAGFANVRDALLVVAPAAMGDFDQLLLEYGDVGDAAAVVLTRRPDPAPTLTLAEIGALFDALAAAKGARARTQLVAEVATPDSFLASAGASLAIGKVSTHEPSGARHMRTSSRHSRP